MTQSSVGSGAGADETAGISPNTTVQGGTGSLTITVPGCVYIGAPGPSPDQPMSPAQGAAPAGAILPFAAEMAPEGYLLCNGAEISREDYQGLFDVIGTTYGVGNGNTTFHLPDLRGRFPLGLDNMGGTSADRVTAAEADVLGGNSGADEVTLTKAQMPRHSHRAYANNNAGNIGSPVNLNNQQTRIDQLTTGGNSWEFDEDESPLIHQGAGQSHTNMPPYLSLNYIIKT